MKNPQNAQNQASQKQNQQNPGNSPATTNQAKTQLPPVPTRGKTEYKNIYKEMNNGIRNFFKAIK